MSALVQPSSLAATDLVAWAEDELGEVSDSPRLDAEVLLAACTGLGRAQLMAWPERAVDAGQASRFAKSVARRRAGEPVAYIVGHREFYSLRLSVSPAVLVPRPETELLVETALALDLPSGAAVVDLGTGSGAIALALKQSRPDLLLTGVDDSTAALAVARDNAARLGLSIRLIESNWLSALAGETFDLIVTNPPYVRGGDSVLDQTLRHEPRSALDGGTDGLDAYRAILATAGTHLRPGGRLLFEHGADQRQSLLALSAAAGFAAVSRHEDLAGIPRVLVLEPAAARAGDPA